MPDCDPPSTRTEPMSTLTFRFFTTARDPVISCVQFPPSPYTRPCCALASGKTNNSTATNLESCFNIHLPVLFTAPPTLVGPSAFRNQLSNQIREAGTA